MSASSNQRIELAVGHRIATITGGSASLHDDGSADGLHDLDLVLADGRCAAIEVTGVVDVDAMQALSASSQRGFHVDGLQGLWSVDLVAFSTANRRRLHGELPALLLGYETDKRILVKDADDPRLADLGVRQVTNHGVGNSFVLSGVEGGAVGGSDVVSAVEDLAGRSDNVVKLRRSDADERHVAVWVDVTATKVYAALNDFAAAALPTTAPSIPTEVDVLWVLRSTTSDGNIDFDVVWRWNRTAGWADVTNSRMKGNDTNGIS